MHWQRSDTIATVAAAIALISLFASMVNGLLTYRAQFSENLILSIAPNNTNFIHPFSFVGTRIWVLAFRKFFHGTELD